MNYKAQITVKEDIDNVEQVFASEEKGFPNGRATYTIERNNDSLVFHVSAKDATAFRAILNSIAKMLAVYSKSKNAISVNEDE